MTARLKVELFELRRAHRLDVTLSIRELARRFGTHRRTVREALASAIPASRKPVVREAPVLEVWKPIIDAWLDVDLAAPRKQRHTARRVWQRLVDEHHAVVGGGSHTSTPEPTPSSSTATATANFTMWPRRTAPC